MSICKYWRNGTCRNGNSCRFDHPNGQSSSNQTGGNRQGSFSRGGHAFGNVSKSEGWLLNEDDIRNDLTNTRPKWILSAYGPGKEPPASLFVENEYSPEEVRWRFYEQQAKGHADAADQEAMKVWNDADFAMRNVAANVRDVQQFMEQKGKEHPNRYDFTSFKFDGKISREEYAKNSQLNSEPGSSINPFGGTANRATATTNPFARPAFGQSASPFGQPAQPSTSGQPVQTSSFGQPSQPSAFGKPAQTAAFGQTAFGQPAQPSAFGQPAFGQSGFGQSGAGQTSSLFGQSKPAFGQSPKPTFGQPAGGSGSSPFGAKPTESGPGSAFGQTSNAGQSNNPFAKPSAASAFGSNTVGAGFGQTAFGQTSTPASKPSPFGQHAGPSNTQSPFGQASTQGNSPGNNASPFGATAQSGPSASPFGANATLQSAFGPSPFGKPSAFGQQQQPQQQQQQSTAFGQPSQPQQPQTSAFGQPSQPQSGFGPSLFGKPAQQPGFGRSPFGQQSQPQPGSGQQTSGFSGFGSSPFGPNAAEQKPQHTTSADGAAAVSQPPPFGSQNNTNQKSPFGNNVQTEGQGAAQGTQPPQPGAQPSSSKPTTLPVQPLHYTQALPAVPPQLRQGERLATYRGMPVTYIDKTRPSAEGREILDSSNPVYTRPDGRGQERIWFPLGAQNPDVVKLAQKVLDFQVNEDKYTEEVRAQYARLFETGRFDQGGIPLVPPMRGWIDYDF